MQTTMTINDLEKTISEVAGVAVEIIIRGERAFTYFFEGKSESAEQRIKSYFSGNGRFDDEGAGYDEETDCTVLYHRV